MAKLQIPANLPYRTIAHDNVLYQAQKQFRKLDYLAADENGRSIRLVALSRLM